MDRSRDGIPTLIAPEGRRSDYVERPAEIDLHMHSTASDGAVPPAAVVARAAAVGLEAIALTDHDTLAGVPEAIAAGADLGVRVIGGCEFSVAAAWGEMHLLGFFLPPESRELQDFLAHCRADRERRARGMVHRLTGLGISITDDDVLAEANGGAVGRPHVARALVRLGVVPSVNDAFDRYLGRYRPAYVEKMLPTFVEVAELVHRIGGVVSAAHLRDRATRQSLTRLRDEGLDAVETRHPRHDPDTRARITDLALELGLARSGGSDWHGDTRVGDDEPHATLGSQHVPAEWLAQLEARRPQVRLA